MVIADALRLYFVAFYSVGVTVLVVKVVPAALRIPPALYQVEDFRRYLPWVFLLLDWVFPLIVIALRAGEIHAELLPVRFTGFALSLYAAGANLWAVATLGHYLVPQAVVLPDHDLVTHGPYRFVRHPAYSGDLALLLGSALGTLNLYLLVLWPISVIAASVQARSEEQLLEAKFGAVYKRYAGDTGRFIPRVFRRAS